MSPTQSLAEIEAKARDHFAGGTTLVLVVDPPSRTITAYRRDGSTRRQREGETVDARAAVPGWTSPVADAFA